MRIHLLAAKTARRYLFARKSHSAVNAISIVSVCGIAVATMAMICVLSVYNGFQDFLSERASSMTADVEVRPLRGKTIADADSLADALSRLPGAALATPVVDDNMLIYFDHRMVPVRVLGVEQDSYARVTDVRSLLAAGSSYSLLDVPKQSDADATGAADAEADIDEVAAMDFDESDLDITAEALYAGDEEMTDADTPAAAQPMLLTTDVISQLFGPAAQERVDLSLPPVTLILPRRTAAISTVNPQGAFLMNDMRVGGALSVDKSNYGGSTAIIDIGIARELLEYTTEAGAVYLSARPGVSPAALAAQVREATGGRYDVADRTSLLSLHFNMMRIEKMFTFLLLAFILLIASFNIVSTLSMLIVDKRPALSLMRRLGASRSFIGEIFCWESLYVCAFGTLAGLLAGLLLCYLQMRLGFIRIPDAEGSLIIDRYPVAIRFSDVLWILIPSGLIALFTALVSARLARRTPASLHDE